jgi:hypothetical protein
MCKVFWSVKITLKSNFYRGYFFGTPFTVHKKTNSVGFEQLVSPCTVLSKTDLIYEQNKYLFYRFAVRHKKNLPWILTTGGNCTEKSNKHLYSRLVINVDWLHVVNIYDRILISMLILSVVLLQTMEVYTHERFRLPYALVYPGVNSRPELLPSHWDKATELYY